MSFHKRHLQQLAEEADIRIDGDRPWDMRVRDERLYARVLADGTLGLGDAYVEGWWDCEDLGACFLRFVGARLEERLSHRLPLLVAHAKARLVNAQRPAKAFEIGRSHYDLGNDLYRAMLDRRMIYSCAYWKTARSLEEAQEAKLDLVCRKIGLKPGQRVLDVGCGWGGLAAFAAERYGAQAVGATVSREQQTLASELWRELPVEFRLQDYRELDEPFDHVVSVGMFEHVGYKNYRAFFEVARRCLKPGGLLLLHTIGSPVSTTVIDPWINKRIFPRAMLPSAAQIGKTIEGLFVIEDWHNFGADYAPTLRAWFANFDRHWPDLRARYDERFYRTWKYFLLSCAALFEARQNQLWQIVLSPEGVRGGYVPVR
jgi:cyclopropane-fatty-acyl-phospholipid synthase